MIYYLDGEELWRGTTSKTYPDQYYTGVGKAPEWNPLEEQRAYGKYGQEDWNYLGGYNGDKMHIILANIPWGSAWSPLVDEEADGTWMAVDYVRIYKPEALLDPVPDTDLKEARAEIALDKSYSLAEDGCIYFSTEITKKPGEELTLTFTDTDNAPVGKVIVDAEGSLLTGITRLTSSKVAASVVQGKQLVKDNEKTLLASRPKPPAANTTRMPSAYGALRWPMPPKRRNPISTPIWTRTATPRPRRGGTSIRRAIRTRLSDASPSPRQPGNSPRSGASAPGATSSV